jgi:pSer/pThr/pTyr-binding forkhead associated (FHA) protein
MKIRLHVAIQIPDERVREFNLEYAGPQVLIGRDSENDIQIPLPEVSRKHARIFEENGFWFVEDAGSASGTRVNGESLESQARLKLSDADVIQVVYASITVYVTQEDRLDTDPDDKTSVVAQRMVRDILDKSDRSDPYLIVLNGRNEGLKATIPASAQHFVVGRAEDVDLCINDSSLSRRHARLVREWNDILIEDLKSKNGVVLNGRKVTSLTRVKDGDHIYLGALHLAFMDPLAVTVPTMSEPVDETVMAEPEPEEAPVPVEVRTKKKSSWRSGIGTAELALSVLACGVLIGFGTAVAMWLN